MYAVARMKSDSVEFSTVARDLQRHLCSLAVLDHRYQRFRQNLRRMKFDSTLHAVLKSSRSVQADMRLLSGRIVELGGALSCRIEEVEHRSYLPLLLGETFEIERFLRQLIAAEKRLEKMLEHTRGLASRRGDRSTESLVIELLENSRTRIDELAQTRAAKR